MGKEARVYCQRTVAPNGTNGRIGPAYIGSFLNYVDFIDCSFSTTIQIETILLGTDPTVLVQRPPGFFIIYTFNSLSLWL